LAETAIKGIVRYPWKLLAPLFHRLLDDALKSFRSTEEIGPPRPSHNGTSLDTAAAALHDLLDSYSDPPFTIQRLCEVLLEPRKQYNRADKLLFALDKLLSVTSTVALPGDLPPRPCLSWLGPVNEVPWSPYRGQPPARPTPQQAAAGPFDAEAIMDGTERVMLNTYGDTKLQFNAEDEKTTTIDIVNDGEEAMRPAMTTQPPNDAQLI